MYQLIVFLPLIGAIIAGFGGSKVFQMMGTSVESHGHASHAEHGHEADALWPQYLTTGFLFVSMLLSWIAFIGFLHEGHAEKIEVLRWIQSGALSANWTLRIDTLTAVMLVVVTTVSAFVHLYSIGYMGHDEHQSRFFAYLSLFTFAMLMLVTSDNLLQLFFGWEGVGLMSYLLIGFWYKRPSANAAAIKAFIVNRVGDFGFALGIFGTFAIFGTVSFDAIFAAIPEAAKTMHFLSWEVDTMTTLCLLLFMGAMGKSAQFLLHTWLPDAMEGPTPVSALIHAATMVTAGVFMVARLSPMFEAAPAAKEVVILVGAVTAFFAATVGLVQNDIKRIIAYSTCSQLGYMFVAMGVGAYGVGMFHLFTHAFFKALLFLGSGSVIHAMGGEQDIRKMGGLAPKFRITWAMMLIGTLALTGFPLTAGYFSKDAIIESAFASDAGMGSLAFVLLVIAALCTAFYSWRLMFLTFHGETRADAHTLDHAHESPNTMLVPLYVLAAGALIAGLLFKEYFIGHDYAHFWGPSVAVNEIIEKMHHLPAWVPWAPTIAMVIGLAIAWLFYIRDTSLPEKLAAMHMPLYKFLLNKWYFDELYDFIFVKPAMWIGRFFWQKGDGYMIDGFGPDGISARVLDVTRGAVRLQTGYLFHYAFAMLLGVAALATWFSFGGRALMAGLPLLSLVTFLPLAGALFIFALRGDDAAAIRNMRWGALWTTIGTFLLSLLVWAGFDPKSSDFQFFEQHEWITGFASYRMGVDGISMPFVILTAFLMPICILASWQIEKRVREYMIAFLVLETLMIGVFCSLDLVLFYLFFEGGLIPMFLIIGVWGGQRRVYASFKFFLYTLLGSVLMLLAIIAMYWASGTTDIAMLIKNPGFPAAMQTWLWLAFFASFAVKMPMWPVHTWLPDAHVEAPTAGSVILAAILLKMGGYGFLRFSLPMFPDASLYFQPFVYTLSVVAIVYTSLVALMQEDMKKLIAYSSVAHMGFVTMGIFSMTRQGIDGAIFQMISHGLVSGALFLCVGIVYDRMHTREIAAYGGLVHRMPLYAFVFMLFTMANVGLPGTSGFVGEFLTFLGTFGVNTWVAFLATTGVILSAAYALWLYRKVIFGELEKDSLKAISDMTPREAITFAPLAFFTVLFGVYPAPVLDSFGASVEALLGGLKAVQAAGL